MSDEIVVIDEHRVELHDSFLRFVPKVFPQASFRRWYEFGGWDASYRAVSIIEAGSVIANVSMQRMQMVIDGVACTGCQLGAVGVVPEQRGRGLQRKLLDFVLQQVDRTDFVFLFANEDVVEFYPLFGFRPVQEWLFSVELNVTPGPRELRRLDVNRAEDRKLMLDVAARSRPVTETFGARDYGSIILWYWSQAFGYEAYFHEGDQAVVFVEHDARVLRICDVLSSRDIELPGYFPSLVDESVDYVEFGFTPDRYFPAAQAEFEYLESPLFVLGQGTLPSRPFKFPILAQT